MPKIAYVAKKVKGSSGALDNHISRTRWDEAQQTRVTDLPESVSHPERTALNKEYILREGESREDAVRSRIKAAGVARAIRSDQVTSLDIIATADHEAMQRIEQAGQLDAWTADCIEATRAIFGRENVVAAMLHMDEHTPHLHITVVPIVQGSAKPRPATRKESEDRDGRPKRRYRRQETAARLCAKDVMTPANMRMWQDTIAAHVAKYGLDRGERGSTARHLDPAEYRKTLDDRDQELTRRENAVRQQEQRIEGAADKAKEIGAAAIEGLHSLLQPGKAKQERAAEVAAARAEERAKVIEEVQQAARLRMTDATAQNIGRQWGSSHRKADELAKKSQDLQAQNQGLKAEVEAARQETRDAQSAWVDAHNERAAALTKAEEQARELEAWRSGLLGRAIEAIIRFVRTLLPLKQEEKNDIAIAAAKITPHGLYKLATARLPEGSEKSAERAIILATQGDDGQNKGNNNKNHQTSTEMRPNEQLERKWAEVLDYATQHAKDDGLHKGLPWIRDAFNQYFEQHEAEVEAGRAMSFGGQSGSLHNREVMAEQIRLKLGHHIGGRGIIDEAQEARLKKSLDYIVSEPQQSRGMHR